MFTVHLFFCLFVSVFVFLSVINAFRKIGYLIQVRQQQLREQHASFLPVCGLILCSISTVVHKQ